MVAVLLRQLKLALVAVFLLATASGSYASVVVSTSGNTATADISLTDATNQTYSATVTIVFDSVINLTPDTINITAALIDTSDPAIVARLAGTGGSLDPNFPMMITVEPPSLAWLFQSGFDGDTLPGNLGFSNAYEFELHTTDLACNSNSPFRLYKAPLSGTFADITDDVLHGSMRARGRGGAFSQFVIARDARHGLINGLIVVTAKVLALTTRILGSSITGLLQTNLLGFVTQISTALLTLNVNAALVAVDGLIADIQLHAGVDLANQWSADHTLVNDAGELLSLAETLRFSLQRMLDTPLCTP